MSSLMLSIDFTNGQYVRFCPAAARPLGVKELRQLQQNPKCALPLEFEAKELILSGQTVPSSNTATLRFTVTFDERTTVFALVPGGWLPMPFAVPASFLVDRNVVSILRRIRDGKSGASEQSLQWWTRLFEEGMGTFNPLPYASEAEHRRKPTKGEFIAAYQNGVQELKASFPASKVVELDAADYEAAYSQMESFGEHYYNETAFLLSAVPLIVDRVAQHAGHRIADKVLALADQYHVPRGSIVSIAVLSCIFESVHGEFTAIGRVLLKPKIGYTEGDAFNAISDVRHIELAAASQSYLGGEASCLCTCDRGMALLWAALRPTGEFTGSTTKTLNFDVIPDMFQRLTAQEIAELKDKVGQ